MTDSTTPAPDLSSGSWNDTFKSLFTLGASALIDSQFPNAFHASNPTPNTAGGPAGTAQATVKAATPAALWLIGGLAAVVLVVLLVRRA